MGRSFTGVGWCYFSGLEGEWITVYSVVVERENSRAGMADSEFGPHTNYIILDKLPNSVPSFPHL